MKARARWSGILFGFTLGSLVTLSLIVVQDHGAPWLPPVRDAGASMEAGVQHDIFLAGAWSTELAVLVDGRSVPARAVSGGAVVTIPGAVCELDVVHGRNTVWSTRVDAATPDTLAAALGGEILVDVEAQGPTGELRIDGRPAGSAPGTVTDVSAGWHTVSVVRDSAEVFLVACRVLPGEAARVPVSPVPPRGQARLLVRSRTLDKSGFLPARGDAVSVDGAPSGATPAEAVVDAGYHSVRVQRAGLPDRVLVAYLEAGATRELEADFGRTDDLSVRVLAPADAAPGAALAVPVRVEAAEGAVLPQDAFLNLVRAGQNEPVSIPLVPSQSDDRLLVAVVPARLVGGDGLTGFAEVTDALGRHGSSELFRIPVGGGASTAH